MCLGNVSPDGQEEVVYICQGLFSCWYNYYRKVAHQQVGWDGKWDGWHCHRSLLTRPSVALPVSAHFPFGGSIENTNLACYSVSATGDPRMNSTDQPEQPPHQKVVTETAHCSFPGGI